MSALITLKIRPLMGFKSRAVKAKVAGKDLFIYSFLFKLTTFKNIGNLGKLNGTQVSSEKNIMEKEWEPQNFLCLHYTIFI